MHMRSLAGPVASIILLCGLTATAAPAAASSSRHGSRHRDAGPALVIRGDQVSTEDLVSAVARAFAATDAGHLVIQPFNTIDGIEQALTGQVDMAAVARPAYPGHPQEAGLVFTPVAWDALVLITNTANPVRNLSLRQIHGIYYGRYTDWSQVGGSYRPIDLVGVASPLDGVQYSFRRLVFGDGNYRVAVPRLFINIDSLQSDVSLDPDALAVSTLVHSRRQKGIKAIPIEGIAPSVTNLASGRYPLPLKIYLAYRKDSAKLPLIQKFLQFLGGAKGSGILRSHGLLPYADATALNAEAVGQRIDRIGAFMVAEGLPASYAPGTQFARLHGNPQTTAHAVALQQADARQVQGWKAAAAAKAARMAALAPKPAPASRRYTVTRGDTLSHIARKYAVSVDDLRKWNQLHGNLLQVGQVLLVSAPSR